jgi:alpha-glucuronidase
MKNLLRFIIATLFLLVSTFSFAEDGYRLWLRYDLISDNSILEQYRKSISSFIIEGESPVLKAAGNELKAGLSGLLGKQISGIKAVTKSGIVIAGTDKNSEIIASLNLKNRLGNMQEDGYLIISTNYKNNNIIVIAGNSDPGVLYGVFHFLRLLQTQQDISNLSVESAPKIKLRLLNHWDNLNRSVERGYAGQSLWNWNSLPDSLAGRYTDYARANASVGINGTVITNVNANALILTKEYLAKAAALANIFRPYGIKLYLTARFSAPVEIGNLKTADPLDPQVKEWWKAKVKEIYTYIPDFGGFLVKANSEGQPGPQNYKRTHADGANMLAEALGPYGGIVMWRAFVYDNNVPDDRAKQAYNEFMPLDGKFLPNVIIQAKNGPVDFQPREPFHPLFGAMVKTPVMPELQITQEYLGASVHLVYLAPLFEECLKSDTYSKGKGTLVANIADGSKTGQTLTAIAGVANIGSVTNWTGHPFGQANWYAFGRLSWDPYKSSETIAEEWTRMTFTNRKDAVEKITKLMMESREIAVNYMTPLGLHHIMYSGHHYGPGPWVSAGRSDWTSVYYHRADSNGIGFNRTSSGSNAVSQYFPEVRDLFNSTETCPENLLLWFNHLPWNYKMKSGNILWDELCFKYDEGVKQVAWLSKEWESLSGLIDRERFEAVDKLLVMQERDARIWKDGCLLYFQTFSLRPFPRSIVPPAKDLDFYKKHIYTDIPGISRGL